MAPNHDAAIAERAGTQLGLLRQPDLDALALTRGQARTLLDRGVLLRVGPGVLRHAGFPRTVDQRRLAALWVAGEGAALSHEAAADVWRFDGLRNGEVVVSVVARRNPRVVDARVHRVSQLAEVDVTQLGLLVVTSPSRTLIDLVPSLSPAQVEEALDGACRRNQIYLPQLEWRIDELRQRGRPRPVALEAILSGGRRRGDEESWLESTYLRVTTGAGLPMPKTQVTVLAGPGGKRYRLDADYDPHDLVVEVDGHATHATRRQRQRDAERAAAIVASGRRLVRFTYEDLTERPSYVNSTVARLLGLQHLAS